MDHRAAKEELMFGLQFGKGNTTVSSMHIEGVKRMVQLRGGIHALKLASPLTARMVAW